MIFEGYANISVTLHVDADSAVEAYNIIESMSAEHIRMTGVANWADRNSTRELPREV